MNVESFSWFLRRMFELGKLEVEVFVFNGGGGYFVAFKFVVLECSFYPSWNLVFRALVLGEFVDG